MSPRYGTRPGARHVLGCIIRLCALGMTEFGDMTPLSSGELLWEMIMMRHSVLELDILQNWRLYVVRITTNFPQQHFQALKKETTERKNIVSDKGEIENSSGIIPTATGWLVSPVHSCSCHGTQFLP